MIMSRGSIILCLILVECIKTLNAISFNASNSDNLYNCVTKILMDSSQSDDNFLWWNFAIPKFERNNIILNNASKTGVYKRIPNIYILNLNDDVLSDVLITLEAYKILNSEGKYLLITADTSKENVKLLTDRYISRILIVNEGDDFIETFTYNPYQTENAHVPNLSVSQTNRCSNSMVAWFQKPPKRWTETTVNLAYFDMPPYCKMKDGKITGFEADLLAVIRDILKFKINFQHYTKWGYIYYPHGSYSGALKDMKSGKIDGGIGLFRQMMYAEHDFETSYAFTQETVLWTLPLILISNWQRVLLILSVHVWVVVLALFLLISLLSYLLHKIKLEDHQRSFFNCVVDTYKMSLGMSIGTAHSLPSMLLENGWRIGILIITSLFTSKLIIVLTEDSHQKKLETVEEVVNSDLKIGLFDGLQYIFENSEYPIETKIYENFIPCPSGPSCVNRTAFQQDMANSRGLWTTEIIIPQYYLDEEGKPIIYFMRNHPINRYLISWLFSKGFPLFPQIDNLLLRLDAHGIISKGYDDVEYLIRLIESSAMNKRNSMYTRPIQTHQLFALFVIYFIGLGLSTVVFVFELVQKRYAKFKFIE